MKPKIISILLSLVAAFLLLSGGYGLWEKELTIKGTIEVVDPDKFDQDPCKDNWDKNKDDKDGRNNKDDQDRKYSVTSMVSIDSPNTVSQNVYE